LKKGKEIFRKLLKIKNSEGVLVQEQFKGKEFLLGIKKTPEFGHVVVFGGGGSFVEEKADVVFRVLDILTKEDVYEMILETRVGKELNNFEKKLILKNALKLKKLIRKNPRISELDINPFSISEKGGFVLDARIVLD